MILQQLLHWARATPNAPFVVTDGGEYSFAALAAAALRMASRLRDAGIVPGDHVALVAGNSAAYIASFFGICATGAVAVTLNNTMMGKDAAYLVEQSDAKLIIADAEWNATRHASLAAAQQELPLFVIGEDADFFDELVGWPQDEVHPSLASDVCTILYTSGTTGLPKGVMCAHEGYLATGRHSARILELTAADRIFVFLPLFHTNPQMYALMGALHVGASLAIRPKFSATTFFEDARRLGATGCSFVGTVLAILAARYAEPQRDHAMRFCIGGGTTAELAQSVFDRFGMFVHELYGMTEIGGWVSGAPRAIHRLGANGLVRDDMDVRVVDEQDRETPTGIRGEIVVRPKSPNVILLGYYRKPAEMVAASRNFWFHTGDIGSFDPDGFLYFHGRSKELIRRGGEMIAPVAIEDRLREIPGVIDCAAVGVPDAIMGEEIKVVIVSVTGIAARSVREHLAQSMPLNMLPRYVEFADRIPRTETEKILRRELAYLNEHVVDLQT